MPREGVDGTSCFLYNTKAEARLSIRSSLRRCEETTREHGSDTGKGRQLMKDAFLNHPSQGLPETQPV